MHHYISWVDIGLVTSPSIMQVSPSPSPNPHPHPHPHPRPRPGPSPSPHPHPRPGPSPSPSPRPKQRLLTFVRGEPALHEGACLCLTEMVLKRMDVANKLPHLQERTLTLTLALTLTLTLT